MNLTDAQKRPVFQAGREIGVKWDEAWKVERMNRGIAEMFALLAPDAPKPWFAGIDATAPVPAPAAASTGHRRISAKGMALIHSFEQCKLEAYPDPGSRDGHPWTIGWGSTGPDIKRGLRWTQAQCDERFARDIAKYEQAVDKGTAGTPTNQNQFDAMVSLCYNIGIGAFQRSTVLRKHRAKDYRGAADAFAMWNKNDGKVMRGLTRRRLAEADLYDDPA